MSTIKSSAENLTLNADGSGNDIILQSNGSNVATIDQAGLVTATTFAGSGASLTALNATNLGSGTVPTARLGSGTASSSTVLYGDQTYKAEPTGGKVLQVVSTNMDDVPTHAAGDWRDITGLAVTLTPAATSSKILIMLDTNTGTTAGGGNLYGHGRILMSGGATGTSFLGTDPSNNTLIGNFSFANGEHAYTKQLSVSWHAWYVPNTTSATTWQAQVHAPGSVVIVNGCGEDDNHANNGRYSSTITAIEIGA